MSMSKDATIDEKIEELEKSIEKTVSSSDLENKNRVKTGDLKTLNQLAKNIHEIIERSKIDASTQSNHI